MSIKPIETKYNGYRFRSRLEARWAVYFDHMGIEYVYEPEGYALGSAGYYLPDFWLPQVSMFAEVKATTFSELEREKCHQLALQSGHGVLMLDGLPDFTNYEGFSRWGVDDYFLFGRPYWKTEKRFYVGTGYELHDPIIKDHWTDETADKAITAARQARFEHGENGR